MLLFIGGYESAKAIGVALKGLFLRGSKKLNYEY
jgi:hypothetical protein